jgi:hypothetical protein
MYAQKDFSKVEIYKLWKKLTNRENTQNDYRFHYDSTVIDFIDSLKASGIDTLGVYSEQNVGSTFIDSCICGLIPWMASVQWIDKGITYQRRITDCCSFETKIIDNSVLIRYYLNNTKQIDNDMIMPCITSVSRDKNGELSIDFSMIDHTTHYLIYCDINNHSKFVNFEKFELKNKESIFHKDNNNSIINSWKELIKNQLKE